MFEDSLIESATLIRTQNRLPALLSLATQLCIAAVILTLPLLHPEILPLPHLVAATLAPPRPPLPPPPAVHMQTHAITATASAVAAPASIHATAIYRSPIRATGPAIDAPALPVINLGRTSGSLPLGINGAAPAAPHVTVAAAAITSSKRISVSSGVSAGHLIAPIRPEYPAIARTAHIEGSVVIEAVISRTGAIESPHVLSGPLMLQQAALAAVRDARYRPFMLNGEPVDVQTTITIVFRMAG